MSESISAVSASGTPYFHAMRRITLRSQVAGNKSSWNTFLFFWVPMKERSRGEISSTQTGHNQQM